MCHAAAPIEMKRRVGVEGRPLAQMRCVGERLPACFRRVAQFSDENEGPLLSVLSYLRPAGRTRCVLRAIDHLLRRDNPRALRDHVPQRLGVLAHARIPRDDGHEL